MTQCWANVLFLMRTNSVGPALNQRCGSIAGRSGQELLELGQSTGSIAGLTHNRLVRRWASIWRK